MFMLRPDRETKQAFEFCLAFAAHRFDIELLAWVAMSNHYHLVVYDPKGQVPAFAQLFNRLLAAVFNDRWKRRENFWSSEDPCITLLATEADVMEKIAYTLGNPVVALLVDTVAEWPGSSSLDYLDGESRTITRPEFYFSADSKVVDKALELTLSKPRGERSFTAWAKRVKERVAQIDKQAAERRKESRKFRSLGVKAVLAKRPTDRPAKKERPRKLRPHVACGNREERIGQLVIVKEFRWQHRDARKRFAEGETNVVFPKGTYRQALLARIVIGKCKAFPKDRLRKHINRIPSDDLAEPVPTPRAS